MRRKFIKFLQSSAASLITSLSCILGLLFLCGPVQVFSQEERGQPLQCDQKENPASTIIDDQNECFFQAINDGKHLHLTIGQMMYVLPLGPEGILKNGDFGDYQYNESSNILLLKKEDGRRIWLNVDPSGTAASKLKIEKFLWNKTCNIHQFSYSYTKGENRLGRDLTLNGGILFFKNHNQDKQHNQQDQDYIIRSMNLGLDSLIRMSEKQEKKQMHPIVSAECLKRFGHRIINLQCHDESYEDSVKKIRQEILDFPACKDYLYQDSTKAPTIIHLHASGFGGTEGRGEYALEELKLAQVFGFNFFHPFHHDHPTPLTGGDLFRPIFFQKGDLEERLLKLPNKNKEKKVSSTRPFDFEKHDHLVESLYLDQLDKLDKIDKIDKADKEEAGEKEIDGQLAKVMDKIHFYHPITLRHFLSKEAKSCLNLTPEIISTRRKDSRQYTGSWKGLFNILEIILNKDIHQVLFHCHGGRHKTGILALAIRYLQDPRWLYGPKTKLNFGIKTDANTGAEKLSWATTDEAFLERSKWEKSGRREEHFKNFIHLLFKPEKGWFNPAETEYINHNKGQVRLTNLTSTRDLFRLLYEPSNIELKKSLMDKYNLSEKLIEEIIEKLHELKKKMNQKLGHHPWPLVNDIKTFFVGSPSWYNFLLLS